MKEYEKTVKEPLPPLDERGDLCYIMINNRSEQRENKKAKPSEKACVILL